MVSSSASLMRSRISRVDAGAAEAVEDGARVVEGRFRRGAVQVGDVDVPVFMGSGGLREARHLRRGAVPGRRPPMQPANEDPGPQPVSAIGRSPFGLGRAGDRPRSFARLDVSSTGRLRSGGPALPTAAPLLLQRPSGAPSSWRIYWICPTDGRLQRSPLLGLRFVHDGVGHRGDQAGGDLKFQIPRRCLQPLRTHAVTGAAASSSRRVLLIPETLRQLSLFALS